MREPKEVKFIVSEYQKKGEFKGVQFKYLIEYFDDPIPEEELTDQWSCRDFGDISEVEEVTASIVNEKFNFIITDDEYSIYVAAQLRKKLNIPGISPEEVAIVRDKVLMKRKLKDSMVQIPILYSKDDVRTGKCKFPVVAKPRAFGGANGVRIFQEHHALQKFIKDNDSFFREDSEFKELDENDLQIEEFIDGDLFHIDGIVMDSEIQFISIGQYVGNCVDFITKSTPLGSFICSGEQERIDWKLFANEVINSITIPDGAMVMPSIEISFDLDLRLEHFYLQLGRKFERDISFNKNSGWLVFPKKFYQDKERYVDSANLPQMEKYQSIKEACIPKVGELASGGFSYMNNNGNFLFEHRDINIIKQEIKQIIKDYEIKVK